MKSSESPTPGGSGAADADAWLRPQSVVFTLLAEHMLDRDAPAVSAGSFIDVLERVGITEHATRATLARMHTRNLLHKERHGRKTYFQMTPRCTELLEGGRERIWLSGAVNHGDAELWTLVTFSLPESWQRKRYDLRVRLTWAGFGALRSGVWIAPSDVDLAPVLEELKISEYAHVFHARCVHPGDPRALVQEAFDLDKLAERYNDFIRSWSHVSADVASDSLVLTLRLSTQWLQIMRDDPRVPLQLLPERWPAVQAQQLFRSLHDRHRGASRASADELMEFAPC